MCFGTAKRRRDCRVHLHNEQVRRLLTDYDLHIIISAEPDKPDDEDDASFHQVFSAGEPGDHSVGIADMFIAPWLSSLDELEHFLTVHIADIRDALYDGEKGDWDKMNIFQQAYVNI